MRKINVYLLGNHKRCVTTHTHFCFHITHTQSALYSEGELSISDARSNPR